MAATLNFVRPAWSDLPRKFLSGGRFVLILPANPSDFRPMHFGLLVQSLAIALGATVLALGAGLAVALACVAGPKAAVPVWLAAGIGTLALPHFVTAASWLEWSANWRVAGANPKMIGALAMTTLALGSVLWPLPAGVAMAGWRGLAAELLECEPRMRGWSLVFRLLIPSVAPSLVVGGVVCFALALSNFTIPILFQAPVFMERVWVAFNTKLDAGAAFWAAWPVLVLAVVAGLVLRRTPVGWPHRNSRTVDLVIAERLRGLAPVLIALGLLIVSGTLLSPLWTWLTDARTWRELAGAWAAGRMAAGHSAFDSTCAATLAVTLGAALAGPMRTRTWLSRICWMPFFVPGVLLGIGFATVLNHLRWGFLADTDAPVVACLSLRYGGIAFAGAAAMIESADADQSDSVRALTGSAWQVWKVAWLPQGGRRLAAFWYIVYLLSLWDVETVILVAPPGGETLAMRVFNLLHYGHAPQVKAVCLLLIVLGLIPLAAAWFALAVRRGVSNYHTNS
jgi:iron(III) transport system permease protein